MRLQKKGQTTAEYAILIGLVIAVAAGVLQVALKGGMRQKNTQALNYLAAAGNDTDGFKTASTTDLTLYNQEYRQTTVNASDYADESVMGKGGNETRYQKQTTNTTAVDVETLNATPY